jgi:hypothetical protein
MTLSVSYKQFILIYVAITSKVVGRKSPSLSLGSQGLALMKTVGQNNTRYATYCTLGKYIFQHSNSFCTGKGLRVLLPCKAVRDAEPNGLLRVLLQGRKHFSLFQYDRY